MMVRTVGEDLSEKKVLDDIAEFGWHCVHILAEGQHVEYSFTVGLFQNYGHPELIIFGLSSDVARQILSVAAHEAKRGAPLDLSLPTDALLHGYSCCFAEVPVSEYYEHVRSEEHTSELQSLMRNSYAVFCLKKKKAKYTKHTILQ